MKGRQYEIRKRPMCVPRSLEIEIVQVIAAPILLVFRFLIAVTNNDLALPPPSSCGAGTAARGLEITAVDNLIVPLNCGSRSDLVLVKTRS
jgi:hypothetical protein